jgi:hypothetical protein
MTTQIISHFVVYGVATPRGDKLLNEENNGHTKTIEDVHQELYQQIPHIQPRNEGLSIVKVEQSIA